MTDSSQAASPAALPAPIVPPATIQGEKLGAEVRRRLAALDKTLGDKEHPDARLLAAFYEARQDEPLWIAKTGLTAKAVNLVAGIKKAGDWGLDPTDFTLPDVPAAAEGAAELSADKQAEAEMQLSLAALKYARFARGGRISDPARQVASYLDRMPQLEDPKVILDGLTAASDPATYLTGLHPQHPQFEKLRQRYLALLKGTAAAPQIVTLPPGPALAPGQKHAQVALLRERLDLKPKTSDGVAVDETLYDAELAAAVKQFQSGKGLRADGIVGAGTRAALNEVEAPSTIRILANMEQWRWMPEDLGAFHVWANIPEFALRVVKDSKIIHEERVITGLLDKQTPVFSDEMELVTFNPRWNVPNSIKVKELYPSLARGGTYFAKQGLRLSKNGRPVDPDSIDWGSTDIRRFDVYQPPGAANVLGVVKFSFPNKHTVYMHDTPTKGLFEEASRPFSHGCVRVRNPMKLAEIILAADKGWSAEQVDGMIGGAPVENPVKLDKPVAVHLTYFTVWIDDEGKEHDFKDVYGHEQRISLALQGRYDEIAQLPDHLAPVTYGDARYASGNTLETFMNNLFGGF